MVANPEVTQQQERERRATDDQVRFFGQFDIESIGTFIRLIIAMFTGDTSQIDKTALSKLSTALNFDSDYLGNTVDRVARGETTGFRAATEVISRIDPKKVDHAALNDIKVSDLIGKNTGPTLLHPNLIKAMENGSSLMGKSATADEIRQRVQWTFEAAERHDLDGAMLANQFWQESRFIHDVGSHAGAKGIAQFMPHHAGKWGFKSEADFLDPQKAIEGGAQFMAHLSNKYGSQSLSLVPYNGGEKAIAYADRNVAGDGVTIGQWMDFMAQERATKGEGRPGLWRNETFGYVKKIDSQYWDAKTIAEAKALQAQAMASIGRKYNEKPAETAYNVQDSDRRTSFSRVIANFTKQNDHIKYGFGAKDITKGAIDCSEYTNSVITAAVKSGVLHPKALEIIAEVGSQGQWTNYKEYSNIADGERIKLSNMHAGMLIAMDTGVKSFDKNRADGIDHVVMTFTDPKTGKLMVGQSSSGGGGINALPAEQWLARTKNAKLFVTDIIEVNRKLAETEITTPTTAAFAKAGAATEPLDVAQTPKPAANPDTLTGAFGAGEGVEETGRAEITDKFTAKADPAAAALAAAALADAEAGIASTKVASANLNT